MGAHVLVTLRVLLPVLEWLGIEVNAIAATHHRLVDDLAHALEHLVLVDEKGLRSHQHVRSLGLTWQFLVVLLECIGRLLVSHKIYLQNIAGIQLYYERPTLVFFQHQ